MKRILINSLLGVTFAIATTAHAAYQNGQLLLGDTRGSGNDAVLAIGQFSSLTSGQTWQLTGANFNSVDFGVIGSQNTGSIIYSTVSSGDTLPSLIGFTTIRANVSSIGSFASGTGLSATPAFNSANGWWQQTDQPGAPSGNLYQVNFANPNAHAPSSFTSGTVVADFYANTAAGATLLGWFSLDSTGLVTWTAVPVPEPAAYGAVAAAGLLLLSLRRQFQTA